MAIRAVKVTFEVNNVLTDVDTAVLSDPTGTYGIKRDDTDAVVIADGTTLPKIATGTYQYNFTEPDITVSYTAVAELIYSGATYYREVLLPVSSGIYITRNDLDDRCGAISVNKWADMSGEWDIGDAVTDAMNSRIDWAIRRAWDVEMLPILRKGPYVVPFSSPAPPEIRDIQAYLACVNLYNSRGIKDYNASTKQAQNQMQYFRDEAREMLTMIMDGRMRLNLATTTLVPKVEDDDTVEDGVTVTTSVGGSSASSGDLMTW